MNLSRPPGWAGNRDGMAATLLIVVIIALLAALTFVYTTKVKRARREADLLDARQRHQWRQRGMEVVTPAPAHVPFTTQGPAAIAAP